MGVNLGLGDGFSDRTPKAEATKEKDQIKNACTSKTS